MPSGTSNIILNTSNVMSPGLLVIQLSLESLELDSVALKKKNPQPIFLRNNETIAITW